MKTINLTVEFEKLVSQFDFEKCQKVMRILDWQWAFDGEDRIPTIEEMIAHVWDLFTKVSKDFMLCSTGNVNISCGGFEIAIYENYDLTLKFVLAEEWFDATCAGTTYIANED